jgi:hypothetical protein
VIRAAIDQSVPVLPTGAAIAMLHTGMPGLRRLAVTRLLAPPND